MGNNAFQTLLCWLHNMSYILTAGQRTTSQQRLRSCITILHAVVLCLNASFRAQDARATAEVPGFRKGAKIPESTMVGFLGGKREMKKLAVERCLRDSLPYALRSVEKNAIADSETIESNPEELIDSFDVTKPLIYLVGVDMPPKVTFVSPYK